MSNESEDEDVQCFLDVELETLRSIYVNELEVLYNEGRPTSVAIQLYPSTADNVDEQYVRMSLILNLLPEYPDIIPDIQIKNPRGLSDEKLQRITDDLFSKAEERKGGTMLFELIERAKDHLTAGNRPSCQCAICLYGFTEQDVFTKTKCYHYFHSHCLSRYVTHQLKEVEADKPAEHSEVHGASKEVFCPVCRIPISFFVPDDSDFPPPSSAKEDSFVVTEELKQLQNKMADLYEKQKYKGGIIDIEAEKKKFLLEISSVPSNTESVPETEQPSIVRRSHSDEVRQDFAQRKRENDVAFSKNPRTSNSNRNNAPRNRENANRYPKQNRKGRDSNYTPGKSSEAKNNKGYHTRKSAGPEEEKFKQHLTGELDEQQGQTDSHIRVSDDGVEKDKPQKTDGTKETSQTGFETCAADELTTVDTTCSETVERFCEDNGVECTQNKPQHSERTGGRPSYQKRYQNYNRRNDSHKQRQYVEDSQKHRQYIDDGGRKPMFNESHAPHFGTHSGSSSRRNENYHQHLRQGDNYHQQRNTGNYNQRYRNTENYHQQLGRRGNYHESRQREDFNGPRQSDNYRQPRQDFYRKPRYQSRYEQYRPNERETQHCDSERSDFSKDHQFSKTSSLQNSNSYVEEKLIEKDKQCVQGDFDKVNKGESFQKRSPDYENTDRRNYSSPRKTNKPAQERHRYQNKYEDRPRNRTNSYMEQHQNSPPRMPENSISKNPGDSTSNKVSTSPDRYPKHPFRRPNGKMHVEARKSSLSQNKRPNSSVKVHKICDVPPVVNISSDCNHEIVSKGLDNFLASAPKGSNNPALKSTDSHSVSRPPPGFAKKVVYGLPSVKPPPGFSQS